MTREIILPPFAPVLMESTRALGYSLESAIADILDNSISANATEINIQFRPWDNPYLFILDNGNGMDVDELTCAMQYGSKNPLETRNPHDLGRFGLGLKTASLSQCRCLNVVSKKDGVLSGARWDLDNINEKKDWSLLLLEPQDLNGLPGVTDLEKLSSGSLVVWTNFDRLLSGGTDADTFFPSRMDEVRTHLSLVFHRFLNGEPNQKRISISINNQKVIPVDPFLVGKSQQIMDIEPIILEGQKITATPFILPHTSKLSKEDVITVGGEDGLRTKQGFYVYRNRRLLVWGTWFRLLRQDELYKLARVKVDIPNSLDHLWTLDIRKSTAVPPEYVRKNLDRVVHRIAEASRRTWVFRGKKEISEIVTHVWNRTALREGIKYTINRDHPLVKGVMAQTEAGENNKLEKLLCVVEASIPFNQLFVDLKSDDRLLGESETDASIRDMVLGLISHVKNDTRTLLDMFTMFSVTEPFSNYPELLNQIKSEVYSND
jgi:hypothetical protein